MRILMVLCLALLSLASLADDVVPVDKVKDSINIRQQPDAGSEIVARLKQGASLPLVNTLDGWYEVQLEDGGTGFVSAAWARTVAASPADELPDSGADVAAEAAAEPLDDSIPKASDTLADEGAAEPVAEGVEEVDASLPDAGAVAKVVDVVEADAETETADEMVDVMDNEMAADAAGQSAASAGVPEVAREASVEADIVEQAPGVVDTRIVSGPAGPAGPPGPPGAASIKGSQNFLVKFKKETEGGNSQIYDDGNQVGIGTTEPKQRLEVNGSIQIHEQNSSVAGLMITQSSGDTGYIMHNRASTLTIGAGSQDRITIDRDGNVGIGVSRPSHPLQMASGAHVTVGGAWTNSSSRDKKENIAALSAEQAMAALAELEPVLFNYRNERQENYVGFIAEDVPALVANRDRDSLSPMDIVAVLTKVVQAQQQKIEELEARLDRSQPGR